VLSGDRRAIALRLPVDTRRAERGRRGKQLVMVSGTFVAFLFVILVLARAHAARKR